MVRTINHIQDFVTALGCRTVLNFTSTSYILGYVPVPGYLEALLMQYPNFNDPHYTITVEDRAAMRVVAQDGKTVSLKPIPLQ